MHIKGILRCANTQRRYAQAMQKDLKRLPLAVVGNDPKSSKAITRGLARGSACFREMQRKRMKSMLKTCTVGLVGFVAQFQSL